MSDTTTTPGAGRPVERFGPSGGQVSGYLGLVIAVVTVGYVAVAVRTTTGLSVALGALLFAALTWALVIRPRVHVFADRLVLRNAFRDTEIALAAVEHVTLGHLLTVWAAGERHQCLGVSRSGRAHLRAERRQAMALDPGAEEALATAAAHDRAREARVVTRLNELAAGARQKSAPGGGTGVRSEESVRHRWAWPELGAVAVTAPLLLLSLLVR